MLQASKVVGITRTRSGLIVIFWLSRRDIREVKQGFLGRWVKRGSKSGSDNKAIKNNQVNKKCLKYNI
jgi:hypothetical protein